MFGHGFNPNYFVNPPAYTYVVHFLLALRYGTDPASVGGAFAADPTGAFTLARAASAVLGALAVPLTAVAGARLFDDRRVGFVAGALLAVAFLPVHYSHFALNDAPTLAPLALSLVGIAAALASPVAHARVRGVALAVALTLAGFLVANPYALLDHHAFWDDGIRKQTETAGDEGGKLGLANTSGWVYYLGTSTWGLGWLPSLFALGGGLALLIRRHRLAWVLVPAPLLLFLYLGHQSRFFARWMLPVYPVLCVLAAFALVALADRISRRFVLAGLCALALVQGLLFSVHNDVVLARADTRMLARQWMVANIPGGRKLVVEPVFPDQWAADVGTPLFQYTGSGNRWNKWRTSRSCVNNDGTPITGGPCRIVKLEDYERTTRPALIDSYVNGGFCWVVTGSTQYGRAYADPKQVPNALRYYRELARRGTVVYRVSPYGKDSARVPFSFDFSFNYYPLTYERPGPEVVIYRLHGGACDTPGA
jgi:hypothetical protein